MKITCTLLMRFKREGNIKKVVSLDTTFMIY